MSEVVNAFPVDLDAEAIFLDGAWYTREDLSRRIKAMLDAQEFTIARPSLALEQLNGALASVRTLAFRAPADLADAIAEIASRNNVSVGQVLREASMAMVMAARQERRNDTQPRVQVPEGPVVTATPVEAIVETPAATVSDKPVELTNLKKPGDELSQRPEPAHDQSSEHRWFNQ